MLWPLIMLITVILLWQKRYHLVIRWLGLVVLTFGLLVISKLWFEACGRTSPYQLYSPSGHTAGSTFVYGAALVLFMRKTAVGFGLAVVIAVVMGTSRVLVHAHNPIEVVVGAGIGLAGVLVLVATQYYSPSAGSMSRQGVRESAVVFLGLGFLVLTATLHGIRSPAEHWVEIWSHRFVSKAVQCPTAF